jgi:hypothetical protein
VSLTVGPSTSDYANIVFKRVSSALPMQEPTFTTDNYNAGSPRWYIQFGQGDYLFGYPSNSNLNGSDFAWSVNSCPGVDPNTYVSYSTAVTEASACGTTVTGLFVVADGISPAPPTPSRTCTTTATRSDSAASRGSQRAPRRRPGACVAVRPAHPVERDGVHEGQQVGEALGVALDVDRRPAHRHQLVAGGIEKSLEHGDGRLVASMLVVTDP